MITTSSVSLVNFEYTMCLNVMEQPVSLNSCPHCFLSPAFFRITPPPGLELAARAPCAVLWLASSLNRQAANQSESKGGISLTDDGYQRVRMVNVLSHVSMRIFSRFHTNTWVTWFVFTELFFLFQDLFGQHASFVKRARLSVRYLAAPFGKPPCGFDFFFI